MSIIRQENPLTCFFKALVEKYKKNTFITNSTNVIIGESVDLLALDKDTEYPRMEILIDKDKSDGYQSQRDQMRSFRFNVAGYIHRENDVTTEEDMFNLMLFGMQTYALTFSFLDDKQAGKSPCQGFEMLDAYPETFYDFEMIPKITTFIFVAAAQIYLPDTTW
jgi:hypothetical protein